MTRITALRRRHSQKGAELVEFTLVFIPILSLISVLFIVCWMQYTTATLGRAVRVAVQAGATATSTTVGSGCLTAYLKTIVQNNSMGLLAGTTGLSYIKVNYLQPPTPGSTAAATDVSTQSSGNSPGNMIQVSVQNYPAVPLMARIVNWNTTPDNTTWTLNAYSIGMIEPVRAQLTSASLDVTKKPLSAISA